MPVKINNVNIVPAPLVTFSKNYIKNSNGVIGADYTISLNGDLIAYKGNPESTGVTPSVINSTGVYYSTYSPDDDPINTSITPEAYLTSIMKKQEFLRNVISSGVSSGSGIKLEITGFNQDRGIKAYCELDSLEFDDKSRWTNVCGYTATLKTNRFIESSNSLFSSNSSEDSFQYYISDAQNSWSFNEDGGYTATSGNIQDQKKVYRVTHSASAVGQRVYNNGTLASTPIQQASGYVHNVIGLGYSNMPSGYLGLSTGLTVVDRKVVENINSFNGTYSIEEEFSLVPSGQLATETVSITIDNDLGSLTKVQINGTIKGLNSSGVLDRSANSYVNANNYWNSISGVIYSRANSYYGGAYSLNAVELSKSVGKNYQEGTISYNYSYDNRPPNLISGALSEEITISDIYPGQIINIIPVIGRSQPIIQYVNSRSEYKRTLQLNASMAPSGSSMVKPAYSDLQTIYDLYKPVGTKVYYSAPSESWNPKNGQYSYTVEWTYEGPSLINNY